MPRIGRTGKIAAVAVAGVAVLGGLGAAGALPDVSDLSGGHSAVETVPPDAASPTGIEHATAGGAPTVSSDSDVPSDDDTEGVVADDADAAGSRSDGLTTASGNVTNGTASAVINALIATEPGPGLGAAVSDVASNGQADVPTDVPPSLPEQASNGQSHKP